MFPRPLLDSIDDTVNPRLDFYRYACGRWCKGNPIPDDQASFSLFDKLALDTLEQLNELFVETTRQAYEPDSVERKIADLYRLALDTDRREKEGLAPLIPELQKIENIRTKDNLSAVLGASLNFGLFDLFVAPDEKNSSVYILNEFQAGFTLGDKEYYTDNDPHYAHIRQEYEKHVSRMFEYCGFDNPDRRSRTVMRLETQLAEHAKDNVRLRNPEDNYHKMSLTRLAELVPQINWTDFLRAMNVQTEDINIGQPEHLQFVGQLLQSESLDDLKTLFLWQTIDGAAIFLDQEMYDRNFHFYEHVISGTEKQQPLWRRAGRIVNSILGEAVGQMYVRKYFPPQNKIKAVRLAENLKAAFKQRILNTTWMQQTTKDIALRKLEAMNLKVGYPDKFRDYARLAINPQQSFYENIQQAIVFEQNYALGLLHTEVDKSKWDCNPQTVNAFYNPSLNEICFPAGILQPPFFDVSQNDAYNYGTIGTIIGHEMTHGFDDEGHLFDKDGNLQNWWTEADDRHFKEVTDKMKSYFNRIQIRPGLFNKGDLTLGENIADQGGVLIAQTALQKILNEQQLPPEQYRQMMQIFYLAFAAIWAENIREEELFQQVKTDPHTTSQWRVKGTLAHINDWYETWNIDKNNPDFLEKNERINIW